MPPYHKVRAEGHHDKISVFEILNPRANCPEAILQVYGALNVMKTPSFIRVEADEVQYALHILLR